MVRYDLSSVHSTVPSIPFIIAKELKPKMSTCKPNLPRTYFDLNHISPKPKAAL